MSDKCPVAAELRVIQTKVWLCSLTTRWKKADRFHGLRQAAGYLERTVIILEEI